MNIKRSANSRDSLVQSSKRKRTSRLIKVNGYSVFKSNNYGIEGDVGLSVWDHELRHKTDADDDDEDEDYNGQPMKTQKKKVTTTVRVINEAAVARKQSLQTHNASIRESLEKSVFRRQEFIRQNWKLVSPFLDPSQSCPPSCSKETAKDIENFKFPVLESQPVCLQNVDMRDYQLAGVNWVSFCVCYVFLLVLLVC